MALTITPPDRDKPNYLLTKTDGSGWWAPTQAPGNSTLFAWGPVMFEVFPLNVHETDHETGTDWAHKEIAGAPIYREWVGENDELYHLRGRIFPYRIGGMRDLERLDSCRRSGVVNALLRVNPGEMMGWFEMERLVRSHTWLTTQGVGPASHRTLKQSWRGCRCRRRTITSR